MYDPARDCFTAGQGSDIATSPVSPRSPTTPHSAHPHQSPTFPPTPASAFPPTPGVSQLPPTPGAHYQHHNFPPTPGAVVTRLGPPPTPGTVGAPITPGYHGQDEMQMSMGFEQPRRRMSRIDELLSPVVERSGSGADRERGGYFAGAMPRETYSPERQLAGEISGGGKRRRPEEDTRDMDRDMPDAEPQHHHQQRHQRHDQDSAAGQTQTVSPPKRKKDDATVTENIEGGAPVQRKLPSFKRKAPQEQDGRDGGGSGERRGDRRDGGDRDRDRSSGRDRGDFRRRSRSPQQGRFRERDRGSDRRGERDTYRRRSRSPYGNDRPSNRRSRSPYGRDRSHPTRRSRSPPHRTGLPIPNFPRDPSPPPPPRSPPRTQRKRPGVSSRITAEEKESLRKLQEARNAQRSKESTSTNVDETIRNHYNEKREMGKRWRTEASKIKGLRSYNNWVKSCIIQKFSPNPALAKNLRGGGASPSTSSNDPATDGMRFGGPPASEDESERLAVLDMGCGKGGDLLKWKLAPQEVGFYVGIDTAEVSVAQARERYTSMLREERPGGGPGFNRRGPPPPHHRTATTNRLFRADFAVRDCWVDSLAEVRSIAEIGFDPNVGPGHRGSSRWGPSGGFDVVSMMFCLHYAFETEAKCRRMLSNVAGSLKKGGRFFGTIPSSDEIRKHLEKPDATGEWGNSIYKVTFDKETLLRLKPPPPEGTVVDPAQPQKLKLTPPFGHRYTYHLDEAVTGVPEYIVPWESFRGLCEDYNLELIYRKPFHDILKEEGRDPVLGALCERMGVRSREREGGGGEGGGRLLIAEEEWEACGFYLAFAFRKV